MRQSLRQCITICVQVPDYVLQYASRYSSMYYNTRPGIRPCITICVQVFVYVLHKRSTSFHALPHSSKMKSRYFKSRIFPSTLQENVHVIRNLVQVIYNENLKNRLGFSEKIVQSPGYSQLSLIDAITTRFTKINW